MLQGTKPLCSLLRRQKSLKRNLYNSNRNRVLRKIMGLVRPHLLYSHKTISKTLKTQFQTLKRKFQQTLDKALSRTIKSLKSRFQSLLGRTLKTLSLSKVGVIRRMYSIALTTSWTTKTRSRSLTSQT
jgi:hypothetical protein